MSNCVSLASAEPFFNLLTASEQEEEEGEWDRRWEGPRVSVLVVILWYKLELAKYLRRSQSQSLQMRWGHKLYPLAFFLPFSFLPFSQELLRVRKVPGELETNGGWHHDRTLHQSLQRPFGELPPFLGRTVASVASGSVGTLYLFGSWVCDWSCNVCSHFLHLPIQDI